LRRLLADVVENAVPWLARRNAEALVVEKKLVMLPQYAALVVLKKLFCDCQYDALVVENDDVT
jgi:hypothetical protein